MSLFRATSRQAFVCAVFLGALTPALVHADSQPPNVSITSPGNGSTYNSATTVVVTASAIDNQGVSFVIFRRNGAVASVDVVAPYTANWLVNESQNGSHTWTATFGCTPSLQVPRA